MCRWRSARTGHTADDHAERNCCASRFELLLRHRGQSCAALALSRARSSASPATSTQLGLRKYHRACWRGLLLRRWSLLLATCQPVTGVPVASLRSHFYEGTVPALRHRVRRKLAALNAPTEQVSDRSDRSLILRIGSVNSPTPTMVRSSGSSSERTRAIAVSVVELDLLLIRPVRAVRPARSDPEILAATDEVAHRKPRPSRVALCQATKRNRLQSGRWKFPVLHSERIRNSPDYYYYYSSTDLDQSTEGHSLDGQDPRMRWTLYVPESSHIGSIPLHTVSRPSLTIAQVQPRVLHRGTSSPAT